MVPWLVMQGGFVGITEELVFRSLFLGYMLARFPAKLRVGSYQVSWAGIILALVFALAHADSFWHEPLLSALGQQIYVFLLGVFYAYLFEESGSVLAPVIAHNAGDFVEWGMCFLLRAVWK
jgi:uncharacterized protein